MKQTIQCLLLALGIAQLQPVVCEAQSKKAMADLTKYLRAPRRRKWEKGLAEHFVVTPHTNFGRTTPPRTITYPETCTWYGAFTFAKQSGNKELVQKLVQRFDPLFGAQDTLIPKPVHVDATVFGSVLSELYMQTKDNRYLEIGKRFADKQWDSPRAACKTRIAGLFKPGLLLANPHVDR